LAGASRIGEERRVGLRAHHGEAQTLALLVVPLGGQIGALLPFCLQPAIEVLAVCRRGGFRVAVLRRFRRTVVPLTEECPLPVVFQIAAAFLPPVPLTFDVALAEVGQLPQQVGRGAAAVRDSRPDDPVGCLYLKRSGLRPTVGHGQPPVVVTGPVAQTPGPSRTALPAPNHRSPDSASARATQTHPN
jgi:hypothetical protein